MSRSNELDRAARSKRARHIAALTGSALLATTLVVGTVGCTPRSSLTITTDGVTVTDETGSQTYTLPELDFQVEGNGTVTVTGSDSVLVEPDRAELSLGVRCEAAEANAVQAQAAQVVDDVVAALVATGLDEESVTVTNTYLNAQYDWSNDVAQIVGYEMYVYIKVKDLTIEGLGQAISVATAAGANSVDGVSYYCSTYDEQYNEALKAALAMAQSKAAAIAAANGGELGDVVSVVEGYDSQAYRYKNASVEAAAYASESAAAAGADGGPSLSLDPGSIEIEASVTVEYEVK